MNLNNAEAMYNDRRMNDNCGNGVLAMAFVNMQPLDQIFDVDEGYRVGTLFPNLDKPFLAGGR